MVKHCTPQLVNVLTTSLPQFLGLAYCQPVAPGCNAAYYEDKSEFKVHYQNCTTSSIGFQSWMQNILGTDGFSRPSSMIFKNHEFALAIELI